MFYAFLVREERSKSVKTLEKSNSLFFEEKDLTRLPFD
jgi:hypothetical protein